MLKRGFQFAPGYRLQEFLGRGQFGQVWRATAPGGAAMAAKFIDLSDGQGQKEYDGIKRVKQIRHANLMPITAIWLLDGEGKVIEEAPDEAIETIDFSAPESGGSGMVIEAVEPSWLVVGMLLGGKSLQQRLRECSQEGLQGIPAKELISYMDESAKGIDFLNKPQHDLGEGPIAIQHCDIKPANIVLIGTSAVVCDFGLARILTRNQVTATSAAGTPAYMAPEAISGKPSRTSDQYSLAVTYYHLRTGTLPVNDGSIWEVLDAHRQGNLRLGLVPEAEQSVLRKATELQWEDRFESCVEMVEGLREALRAEGHTRPSFASPDDTRTAGRNSANAATADAATQAIEGDPTATLDVPPKSGGGQEPAETQPFGHADQSTQKEGFRQETEPAVRSPELEATLDQPGSAPGTRSLAETVKKNSRILTGGAVGAAAVFLLAALAMWGGDTDRDKIEEQPGEEELEAVVVNESEGPSALPEVVGPGKDSNETTEPLDPQTLVRSALASFDTDRSTAVKQFSQALQSDPGLQPEASRLAGHQGEVLQMQQCPDGTCLVSLGDGPTPLLWNLESNADEPIPLKGHSTLVTDFAISNQGQQLLSGGFDAVGRVWNLRSPEVASQVLELQGHRDKIEAVAWQTDKRVAATASADATLGIWEIGLPNDESPNGALLTNRILPIGEMLTSLVSDPSGIYLAAETLGSDPIAIKRDVLLFRWDDLLETKGEPKPIRLGNSNAKVLSFLHSEPILVTGDVGGTLTLYTIDGDRAKLLQRLKQTHVADVEALKTVDANGVDIIVSGSTDGTVTHSQFGGAFVPASTRKFSRSGIMAVDVSSDGQWVAAGAADGTVWLWNATETNPGLGAFEIVTGSDSVGSVMINEPLNLLIAGCADGIIRVYDLRMIKLLLLTDPTPPPAEVDETLEIKNTPIS